MTAAAGHPSLRRIRCRVASWTIDGIKPGRRVGLGPHGRSGVGHDFFFLTIALADKLEEHEAIFRVPP
ncbi:hypothetical protein THITH_16385 [Thioalkalivibrio paradoxus ARh 1]|uniref:Uncharacterized protein n=1 Tax=Thioalkalivibrio paradoxus ARh 1 TaxID=713585 RepID=W0DPB9_9GAMM|nr:hypothetical protein THITH_16385 [Thioalkalivibrio paradoxus ARh 1]